jgi:hypothetical protein
VSVVPVMIVIVVRTLSAVLGVEQAGVALGLARIVSTRFPVWGPEFAAFMVRPQNPSHLYDRVEVLD